ncbi:MAG: formylglycine-generating enzyme family protein [Woeseiaceae bacterium]
MTLIPGGSYLKGSPQDEPGRFTDDRNHDEDDQVGQGGDQVEVTVLSFALGIFEVSNREFAEFIEQTGYAMRDGCIAWTQSDGKWRQHTAANWKNTGRPYDDAFPASCIDWYAANAYIDWLSETSEIQYRLPTESEFEYARRAGSAEAYHFGSDPEESCRYGNVPDAEFDAVTTTKDALKCSDGYWDMAPVGQFEPNAFGIYDITGNVWEWLSDCYEKSYANAPTDGSALILDRCEARSIRGGSWGYDLSSLRSADRSDDPPDALYDGIGFRIARDRD